MSTGNYIVQSIKFSKHIENSYFIVKFGTAMNDFMNYKNIHLL